MKISTKGLIVKSQPRHGWGVGHNAQQVFA